MDKTSGTPGSIKNALRKRSEYIVFMYTYVYMFTYILNPHNTSFLWCIFIIYIWIYIYHLWTGSRVRPPFPSVSYEATKRRRPPVLYRNAGPKRCHHSQTSRTQSPLNQFYTWFNLLLTGLHHSFEVRITLHLPSNSSILTLQFPPLLSSTYVRES